MSNSVMRAWCVFFMAIARGHLPGDPLLTRFLKAPHRGTSPLDWRVEPGQPLPQRNPHGSEAGYDLGFSEGLPSDLDPPIINARSPENE
jgi:hypothetical protein